MADSQIDEHRSLVAQIDGEGFAAVYDALTACINTISGICCQPRCASGNVLGPAGEYLETIEDFLHCERRRIMRAAEAAAGDNEDDGNHGRVDAVLQFKLDDADFSLAQKTALLETIRIMERQG